MTAPCKWLAWDTEFFGQRIGRALVNTVDEPVMVAMRAWCDQHEIDCLYFLSSADDPLTTQLLAANHFDLVDIRMTLQRHFAADWSSYRPTIALTDCTGVTVEQLKAIAEHSYRASRFYFDPRFSDTLCDRLYELWIEKSCQDFADHVVVGLLDGEPAGFVTCSLNGDMGQIGLVGVDARTRGQGVGQQIIMAALQWFYDQGCNQVEVVTQGRNIAAQRLYQRCGFVTQAIQLWYHYWPQQPLT